MTTDVCREVREIEAMARQTSGEPVLHFDDEMGGARPDMARAVDRAGPDAHLHCCGPRPMLDALQAATSGRPSQTVHLEYFGAREAVALAGGYRVVRKSSTLTPDL
jgi:vanillate O-demethylase ferredoxin subunit